jgi:hypothetical protein
MPTAPQREQHKDLEQHRREAQKALISEQVIYTLGEPAGLHKVQVQRLWEDHYRVNVLIGPDAVSARIANSYFLTADSDGKIIASNPKLTKRY